MNYIDEYGKSYLHRYINTYDEIKLEVVKYLLEQGLAPSLNDNKGTNVYQFTEKRGEMVINEYIMQEADKSNNQ